MTIQADWRYCQRCYALFYGHPDHHGVCHDGASHDPRASGNYLLNSGGPIADHQDGWRWCRRCQVLAFSGHGSGTCHDGQPHDFTQSDHYVLALGPTPPGAQEGWRWCSRCQNLTYGRSGPGLCWDGARHTLETSGTYSVLFEEPTLPTPPAVNGTMPFRVRVGRYLWQSPPPGAVDALPWPVPVHQAVFDLVRDYWRRVTFGIVELSFDVQSGAMSILHDLDPSLATSRGAAISAIRDFAVREQGIPLNEYDGFIAFVHSPPSDAGGLRGRPDALLDQGGNLEFFEHEVGHVIGFDHAFPVYDDRYCVMGETWRWDHNVARPAVADGITFIASGMWRGGRRISAASLFRRFGRIAIPERPLFDRPYVVDVGQGESVLLSALSGVDRPRAVMAIVATGIGQPGLLTVEYRTATGDDVGLRDDAVVIHSIGHRQVAPGHDEVDPPWLETTLPVRLGASVTVAGARITVGRTRPAPALYGPPIQGAGSSVYLSVG